MSETRHGWLVVEDEALVAVLIEDAIAEMDLAALGPATTVPQALQVIETTPPEGALLDVNLGGQPVYPVADVLAARSIPFVFITGYGEDGIRKDYADRPVLQKPFMVEDIQKAINAMRGVAAER